MVSAKEVREKYISYFERLGHKKIAPALLVPKDDPTTLFTSSGMQQLIPYLRGRAHPMGKRLVDVQPCIRTNDIAEVGDNRHLTFLEMLGNWSLGDYFKREQLEFIFNFFTKELSLPKERLCVSVFKGNSFLPKDEETYEMWRKLGVDAGRIYFYGDEKNWWSRSGVPNDMPYSEIGGPDSEVFYDLGSLHDKDFGATCHPNCGCGRFLEIGNSVFIQFIKERDGSFKELPQRNVDFGGGLERITAAVNNNCDVYKTDLFSPIIGALEEHLKKDYTSENNVPLMRIIADHLRAATILIGSGVEPSNKAEGYVLRRLLRRARVKLHLLGSDLAATDCAGTIAALVLSMYDGLYVDKGKSGSLVHSTIKGELERFGRTMDRGLRVLDRLMRKEPSSTFSGEKAFMLYESYGFPFEVTGEIVGQRGFSVDEASFIREQRKHAQESRTASSGMFKGGLADTSSETIKLHTATHLLHAALRGVLGGSVSQKGSNITTDRLRFDFLFNRKLSGDEIKEVERIVNYVIDKGIDIKCKEVSLADAEKEGALAFFGEKYSDRVLVYTVGNFSKEICGGPHVKNTGELGRFKIISQESVGSAVKRIKAVLL